jgi:DnaJ-domain-containing protein 1
MVEYVSIAVVGALAVGLLTLVVRRVLLRQGESERVETAIASDSRKGPGPAGVWSSHVGRVDAESIEEAATEPAWKQYEEAVNGGMARIYRTRPTFSVGGPHWDPYAESQSRANRARAARRRPRPHRPGYERETTARASGKQDLYELLGVSTVATGDDIERAFRQRVTKIHPDRFHHDPEGRRRAHEQLKRLNAAMEILRDPARRAEYDLSRLR